MLKTLLLVYTVLSSNGLAYATLSEPMIPRKLMRKSQRVAADGLTGKPHSKLMGTHKKVKKDTVTLLEEKTVLSDVGAHSQGKLMRSKKTHSLANDTSTTVRPDGIIAASETNGAAVTDKYMRRSTVSQKVTSADNTSNSTANQSFLQEERQNYAASDTAAAHNVAAPAVLIHQRATTQDVIVAVIIPIAALLGIGFLVAAAWAFFRSTSDSEDSSMSQLEEAVSQNKNVVSKSIRSTTGSTSDYYYLHQSVAIVRHGDRLDHTDAWEAFPDRERWPNDTPLSPEGHSHSRQVGDILASSGKPFAMIISSPYFRCAQTASRIAQVLKIPIHFDLDIGEVFDDVSMTGVVAGVPQHRAPGDLLSQLKPDFPEVEYIRDEKGGLKIEGRLQDFPENFDAARMRFAYKVKKLMQKAAAELFSIIIVTHGDALGAVVGLMREDWLIREIPYTSFCIGSRDVKVLKKGGKKLLEDEAVYNPDEWTLKLSDGFDTIPASSAADKKKQHVEHEKLIKDADKMGKEKLTTEYHLHKDATDGFKVGLSSLGAHDEDMAHMLARAGSSSHMLEGGKDSRVKCSPQAAGPKTVNSRLRVSSNTQGPVSSGHSGTKTSVHSANSGQSQL